MPVDRKAGARGDLPLQPGDLLLVVDVQNDFLPGGRLAVHRGDEVVPVLNEYIARFVARGLPVLAARDWHPPDHCSFDAQGGRWPQHCVAGTPGADFAPGLRLPPIVCVIAKASRADQEAYSAFAGTELAELLRQRGISRLFVGGLATDYCVVNTVRDALAAGFGVVVLTDAVRPVDLQPGDGERALARMSALGARLVHLDELPA
ncbi:MAG: nicotinamidase [Candidatus Accumulibacter sp.]|uniref:nicotinamidase n=1 Tax=Accumulibacter sp. TaxID=2053492 RepID=UPI001A3E5BA1|nr:nicotinamidase [Accumulibacter sp.]MBL8394336.1 nicotinamidase [Accumulibacter sp.]